MSILKALIIVNFVLCCTGIYNCRYDNLTEKHSDANQTSNYWDAAMIPIEARKELLQCQEDLYEYGTTDYISAFFKTHIKKASMRYFTGCQILEIGLRHCLLLKQSFVTYKIREMGLGFALPVLGLIAYPLTYIVLSDPEFKHSISTKYHHAIVILDTIGVLPYLVTAVHHYCLKFHYVTWFYNWIHFMHYDIMHIFTTASVFLLAVCSLLRAIAIWFPLKYSYVNTKELFYSSLVIGLLLGVFFRMPEILFSREYFGGYIEELGEYKLTRAPYYWSGVRGGVNLLDTVVFAVCLIIIIGCNSLIISGLFCSKRLNKSSDSEKARYTKNLRAAGLLFCISYPWIVCACCAISVKTFAFILNAKLSKYTIRYDIWYFFEAHTYKDIMNAASAESAFIWLYLVCQCMYIFNHSCKFYMYVAFHARFRQKLISKVFKKETSIEELPSKSNNQSTTPLPSSTVA